MTDKIHGFILKNKRYSQELEATLWEYEHEKTGAQLIWLDNKDSNKLFSIAFKTIPRDDRGVFHILEHSVLCGSERYPLKQPFVELLKSSMNTFLNALTFPDKTVYPISSRNDADYVNLMRVYLDAVFFPKAMTDPNIFYQEGWHYEIRDPDDVPSFKGVVFNEMKGALSSADAIIDARIWKMLYPDNCYQYVSGGDPKCIPSLTYEDFRACHDEFYNPSNARIYLDGDIDLDKILGIIDGEYLSRFEKGESAGDIPMQKPVPSCDSVAYYEIDKDDPLEGAAHIAFAKIISDISDRKKTAAVSIVSMALTGSNEAPLKKAVIESGYARDVELYQDESIRQPFAGIYFRNTDADKREELRALMRKVAEEVIENGLPEDELNAAISQLEYQFKTVDEPKAVSRNISALIPWLHGLDPMGYLCTDDVIDDLKRAVGTDYYTELIREIFLDDEHLCSVTLIPSYTKGEEDRSEEAARLNAAKSSWSGEEIEGYIQKNRLLDEWQGEMDRPETISLLPKLRLEQISAETDDISTEMTMLGDIPCLYHRARQKGISHINLYYTIADCDYDTIRELSLMTNFITELPTAGHTIAQLQMLFEKNIGDIDFNIECYPVLGRTDAAKAFFTVSMSLLDEYIESALPLVREVLTETEYGTDRCASLIHGIILQGIDSMSQSTITDGSHVAIGRIRSHFSAAGKIDEIAGGQDFLSYLTELEDGFDERIGRLQDRLAFLSENFFTSDRLTISITSAKDIGDFAFAGDVFSFGGKERKDDIMPVSLEAEDWKDFTGIPANIGYSAWGNNLGRLGMIPEGGLRVMANIVTYSYLWNEIRVKGGAYGCGCSTGPAGDVICYSYRDPSPSSSLDVFRGIPDFIRRFSEGDEEMDQYIISTLASAYPLRSDRGRGHVADIDVFRGMTGEMKKKEIGQILSVKKDDMYRYAQMFDVLSASSFEAVVGPENMRPEGFSDI